MKKQAVGRKQLANRLIFYGIGIVILALGITLNTKTGLGVSALVSIAYTVAGAWNLNFALMTFVLYSCFVLIELFLKTVFLPELRSGMWHDLLQIPFSLAFSLLLNLYGTVLPVAQTTGMRMLVLVLAIVCTGVGAAMIVDMHLIPNPADGLAQTIGLVFGKGMGFGKNILDCSCVAISVVIGLVARGRLIGIGVGTIIAMIAVGRVVALFNRCCETRIRELAGTTGVK
ncbi:MAG: hypothetical protein BHW44_00695 [Roseburia sp. 40_7]|uniref:YczE/YyaS/YitT family protein n=1 Tax=uncultured Eubacterium sp. TaxID=165185 RepID=UPI00095DD870|nr:DUF6198 family protein [uncultured Eubacterium sp.]MCI6537293.1 DUF6198 family protein [Lachnospiraceae bacterium]OLA92933.1 MAG: hypothetical protein BHW44_00695 [Roseburia sp. 40_7]